MATGREKLITPEEAARIHLYSKRRALQENMFASQLDRNEMDLLFEKLRRWFALNRPRAGEDARLFVALPHFISTTFADLLFLETPTITSESKSDAEDEWIKGFLEQCRLARCFWESAESNSAVGDDYWKVFLREGEDLPVFEPQDPAMVFPKFDGAGTDPVEIQIHRVLETDDRKKTQTLQLERHFPGLIINRVVKANERMEIIEEIEPERFGLVSMMATGVDRFLVIHVGNRGRARRYFGVSDYDHSMEIFEEISHRVIRLVTSLDVLADPKFQGPDDYVDDRGNFQYHGAVYYPRRKDDPEVEPITWDNRAEMQLATIDALIQKVLGLTQVWPGLLSPDKFGQLDSGRALRLRMMSTLWATRRKRKPYTEGIGDLFLTAQLLQEANRGRLGFDPARPAIAWSDILPFDTLETAQVEAIAHKAQLRSRRRAVQRLNPTLSAEEIDRELEAIEEEQASALPQFMRGSANGGVGNGGTRLPQPRLPSSL